MGFIQKLPTQLVAAFRATLEEIGEASLLLHVVDVSSPNAAAQTDTVCSILQELGIDLPIVTVWNKARISLSTLNCETRLNVLKLVAWCSSLGSTEPKTHTPSPTRGWCLRSL